MSLGWKSSSDAIVDTFSKTERSKIMASVKSKNNKSTELRFLSILKEKDITGWRRNYPATGRPDFVFPRLKIAVFIDGRFWHSCPKHCRLPASNKDYWNTKIERNRIRDKKTSKALKDKGWTVIRIWEHEIKTSELNRKLNLIKKAAQQGAQV
ncbi:MAG: very short patch repair endonuclease [Deltaproteobacteria bacterium CG_4_8_14_3_um_filter_45_9]|nr:MAG: very short patch repair endonuclease [Deltaproteobacteria bacterium CG03_land_8_20_14_0_80_45_14]PIX22093.1 MAG: very short patch repair endonuclease [Deltaproteobacteria bacterium CG_4_8_14_3_um_filter_45_9]